jgi:hypothetical protein
MTNSTVCFRQHSETKIWSPDFHEYSKLLAFGTISQPHESGGQGES